METQPFRPREMIPNWKSITNTPTTEMAPARRAFPNKQLIEAKVALLTQRFRSTGGIEEAVELVEAASAFGVNSQSSHASNLILRQANIPLGMQILANKLLKLDNPEQGQPPSAYERAFQIGNLKKLVIESPRDSLATIELARLYFIGGQYNKAEKFTERALQVSPNNRFILRAASCLWHRTDNLDKALHFLRKSPLLTFDPWVQSAEIAVATSLGRQTKVLNNVLVSAKGQNNLSASNSELAASLASLEFHNGKTKQAKKLLQSAMITPNGNSLAQLRWFQKSKGFAESIEPTVDVPNAFEAGAYDALRAENIDAAIVNSVSWFNEQPFQVSAALLSSSLTLAITADYDLSFKISDEASRVNPRSFGIQNNKLVALCLLKRVDAARAVLQDSILSHRVNESNLPFQFAASGLVAFTEGNFTAGRHFYSQAIQSAASNKDGGLVIAALIYYLWQELINGQTSLEDVQNLVKKIDKITEKNRALRKTIKLNWNAFKMRLAHYLPQSNLSNMRISENTFRAGVSFLEREQSNIMSDFGDTY